MSFSLESHSGGRQDYMCSLKGLAGYLYSRAQLSQTIMLFGTTVLSRMSSNAPAQWLVFHMMYLEVQKPRSYIFSAPDNALPQLNNVLPVSVELHNFIFITGDFVWMT